MELRITSLLAYEEVNRMHHYSRSRAISKPLNKPSRSRSADPDLKIQMLLEERQHIGNYTPFCAPVGIHVPQPVVLLGFVHNAKLIQLVREGLVRVHVVPNGIVARPVKLETT